MSVHEWFADFTARHTERHPRDDWPGPDRAPAFWAGWLTAMEAEAVAESEAEAASVRMQGLPPEFPEGQLARLLSVVRLARAARSAGDRAEATAGEMAPASAACKAAGCECHGGGWVTRYRRFSRPALGRTAVFYGDCPAGRALHANHRRTCPEIARDVPRLADHPELRDAYREPPTQQELDDIATKGAF
jgi:hypothetical protein